MGEVVPFSAAQYFRVRGNRMQSVLEQSRALGAAGAATGGRHRSIDIGDFVAVRHRPAWRGFIDEVEVDPHTGYATLFVVMVSGMRCCFRPGELEKLERGAR